MNTRDAINEILLSINELPLDDTDLVEDLPSAIIINKELEVAKKKILGYGWHCNTMELSLSPNTEGYVVISQTYLSVKSSDSNITVKDWKLFDKSVPTYKFTDAQTIEVVEDIPFDDIPFSIANYIVQVASLQAHIDIIGSSTDIQAKYKQIVEAKTLALRDDANAQTGTVLEGEFESSLTDRTAK